MSRKRRNGSVTAHGREWKLYEQLKGGMMLLLMRPKDKAEKVALDGRAIQRYLAHRRKGAYEYFPTV